MSWLDSDTALRDGTALLCRFQRYDGQPDDQQAVLVACWSEAEDCWVAAARAVDGCEVFFYSDFMPGILTGWLPMPASAQVLPTKGEPPLDRCFIAVNGFPWPVVAHWCPVYERFIMAEMEASMYKGLQDPGWVSECFNRSEMTAWMPLPAPGLI